MPDLGGSAPSVTRLRADNAGADGDESPAATRITLRPHDPGTGEEIEKREVVKGYEYSRGQFLTFTAEELKALDVESSKVIDLEKFVAGDDIDLVYFDSPYFVHPDGPIAVETLRVIGAAMAEARVVGLGRLTLSRRERISSSRSLVCFRNAASCCGGSDASNSAHETFSDSANLDLDRITVRHTGVFVGAGFAPAAARLHPEDRGSDAGALVFECRIALHRRGRLHTGRPANQPGTSSPSSGAYCWPP